MTRYFVDTEFWLTPRILGRLGYLISVGIMTDGPEPRTYYAELCDWPMQLAEPWIQENVVPHLHLPCGGHLAEEGDFYDACTARTSAEVARDLRAFCDPEKYGTPEFWTDHGDYDYVILSENVFGGMAGWPQGWPMYFNDIQQEIRRLKVDPDTLPPHPGRPHHALEDALHVSILWHDLAQTDYIHGRLRTYLAPEDRDLSVRVAS